MASDTLVLDWKSEAIIAALYGSDGEATTPELSGLTGIDDNRQILYRLREKLEPEGLVEVGQADPREGGGRIPPTQARLTSDGEELAEELDEERGRVKDVVDRIERVEADLNKIGHVQTELSELQERIESMEEAINEDHLGEGESKPIATEVEELNQRVSFLWDAMLAIRNFLETEHDVDLKEYIEDTETDDPSLGTDQ
jgi:chromosome segregation ATPase